MNYILLNDVIFNQENLKDSREISSYLTDRFLKATVNEYYFKSDYDQVISEVCSFMSNKNANLIVSTFYYKLPCFVELLKTQLNKNTTVIPLFDFFCSTTNNINTFYEIYNKFVISTKYSVANNVLKIIKQEIQKRDINVTYKDITTWKGIQTLNQFCEDSTIEISDFEYYNFYYMPQLNVADNDYTIDTLYTEIQRYVADIVNSVGATVFSYLTLCYKYMDSKPCACLIDIQQTLRKKTDYKTELVTYCIKTMPQCDFNKLPVWMLVQQNDDATSKIEFVQKKDNEEITQYLNPVTEHLKREAFSIGNSIKAIKFMLDARPDIFGNLHVGLHSIGNQFMFNLIIFR